VVTPRNLSSVERAEAGLADLGFAGFRVRHHGDLARIEVPVEQFQAIMAVRERAIDAVRHAGYAYGTLDLVGFRSGSSNEVL